MKEKSYVSYSYRVHPNSNASSTVKHGCPQRKKFDSDLYSDTLALELDDFLKKDSFSVAKKKNQGIDKTEFHSQLGICKNFIVPEEMFIETKVCGPAYGRKMRKEQKSLMVCSKDEDIDTQFRQTDDASCKTRRDWRRNQDSFTRNDVDFISKIEYEPMPSMERNTSLPKKRNMPHIGPKVRAINTETDIAATHCTQSKKITVKDQLAGTRVFNDQTEADHFLNDRRKSTSSGKNQTGLETSNRKLQRERALEKYLKEKHEKSRKGRTLPKENCLSESNFDGVAFRLKNLHKRKTARKRVLRHFNLFMLHVQHHYQKRRRDIKENVINETLIKKESESLFDACNEGDVNIARSAIEFGAVVDSMILGRTPFQLVFLRLCKIDSGLEIEPTWESQSDVPKADYEGILELLYEKGADINLVESEENGNGWAPLHYAASLGCFNRVKWLMIDRGARIDVGNIQGDTPLMRACEGGYLEIVLLFVKSGAELYASNSSGMTVMHFAAASGNITLLKFLMECGVDKTCQTVDGKQAIDICMEHGFNHCAEFLKTATVPRESPQVLINDLVHDIKGGRIHVPDSITNVTQRKRRKRPKYPKERGRQSLSLSVKWRQNWSRMMLQNT